MHSIRPVAIASGTLFFSSLLSASLVSTTTLSSVTPAAPVFGQKVTLVATVTPPSAPGFVSFLDQGVLIGTGTLNASGIAQATTLTLHPGPHSLKAVYGGNFTGPGYLPSTSPVVSYIVTAAPGVGFATPVNYTAGGKPVFTLVGDFNADGKADLVVSNFTDNNVSVFIGNGNGTFQPAANHATGTGPVGIAVGDFNGDGKADLAVANQTSGNVSVLLGNGDGSFQAMVNYPAGSGAQTVGVGDLNNDGIPDLVVGNGNSASISMFLGHGDGTFTIQTAYPAGSGPTAVVVADFNGDGNADAAVSDYGGGVSTLIGNGTNMGPYSTSSATTGSLSDFVVAGDFNGDGILDLAVSNNGSNNVSILEGTGGATFLAGVNYSAGSAPTFVAVGDFNGDGKLDLVLPDYGGNNVSLLLGNGSGSFSLAAGTLLAGTQPVSVAVGDFNGDGIADLAVSNYGSNNISVLLGTAPPSTSINLSSSANPSTFGEPVTLTATVTPSNAPGVVEFFDGATVVDTKALNLSGQAQITTSLLPWGANSLRAVYGGVAGVWKSSQSNTVHLVVNSVAASGLAAPLDFATDSGARSVAVGDFNGDGKQDLAVTNLPVGDVSVLLGNGNGTFQTAVNYNVGSGPAWVAVGDFNGDGRPDLAVANINDNDVSVLIGNGNGTFQVAVNYAAGSNPISLAVGDFNGDGKADLAVADDHAGVGNVAVLLGNGNGTFQSPLTFSIGSPAYSITVSDFNRDGFADLAVANLSGSNISVLLGNGNGTFQASVNYATGTGPNFIVAGDFNSDGKPDIAVTNQVGRSVSVLLGNGDGTFQSAANYPLGMSVIGLAIVDLNGDGKIDLAMTGGGGLPVLLGNGDGTFQPVSIYSNLLGAYLAAGDFNGDGRADLAVTSAGVNILLGTATALQFFPVAPCRIADTRTSQPFTGAFGPPSLAAYTSRDFPILSSACSIPGSAQAYSLNFTVVPSGPLGFLSAWPAGGAYPGVSTLNSTDGSVIANAAILPAGTSGGITVVAGNPTDLVIDINGYFAPAGASSLDFFPLTPCRIADTRTTQPFTGAFGPPSLSAYVTRDFPISTSPCLSGSEQAYSLNMTVVPPGPVGFLSAWPVGQAYPGVSTLNSPGGNVIANAAIVPAGTHGDIDVVVGNPTDVVIDINGKFATPGAGGLQFYALTPCRVADTRTSQPFTGAFGPPSLAAYASRDFPIQSSPCGIPVAAQAYALNMTVVPSGPLGFLSTWPAGQAYPGVSTLNSPSGDVIANAAIVPAGTGGAITVVTGNATDLIIDVVGFFAP